MSDDLEFFGGIFLYMLICCLAIAGLGGIILAAITVSGWIAFSLLLYVPAVVTGIFAFLETWF